MCKDDLIAVLLVILLVLLSGVFLGIKSCPTVKYLLDNHYKGR